MFVQTLSDNNDEKQVILLRFVIQLSKPEYVIKLSVLHVHIVATIEYDSATCPIQSHLSRHYFKCYQLNYQGPTCAILKCQCWKHYRVELYHLIDT